jgi:hypothetical protein
VKPYAPFSQKFRNRVTLGLSDSLFSQIALDNHRERKEVLPTFDNLQLAPTCCTFCIDMKNDVVVILKHAVSAAVDGEDIRELLDAIDDPLAPVFMAFTAKRIHAAEKGAAYTA